VPFSKEPSIDDTQNYILPATPFDVVLDTLISDLESIKGDAVRRYFVDESPKAWQNSSKVTRWTVYALLADLYLWKGDWDNAIKYCDLVIDLERQQYEEALQLYGNINDVALIDSVPMILEKPVGMTTCGYAYTTIFGTGNSFESIFELSFESPQSVKNDMVSKYYGNSNYPQGYLSGSDILFKDVAQGNTRCSRRLMVAPMKVESCLAHVIRFASMPDSLCHTRQTLCQVRKRTWASHPVFVQRVVLMPIGLSIV
jgi:hypothetical protein